MGHRALVAIRRSDGRYDLYHSQWGAYGFALAPTLERSESPPDGIDSVSPDPVRTAVDETSLWESVDPLLHEAVYVLTPDSLRTYLTTSLGVSTADPSPGVAIQVWPDTDDAAYVRGYVDGAKESLAVQNETSDGRTRRAVLTEVLSSLASKDRQVVTLD